MKKNYLSLIMLVALISGCGSTVSSSMSSSEELSSIEQVSSIEESSIESSEDQSSEESTIDTRMDVQLNNLSSDYATIILDDNKANPGDTVMFKVELIENYILEGASATTSDNETAIELVAAGDKFGFIMPDDGIINVTVDAHLTNTIRYKTHKETSAIADGNFRNGFYLISPESTNQYFECNLDYNGEAESDTNDYGDRVNYWSACQWWTPFNFKDAEYEKKGDLHTYTNESRYMAVDTNKGELTMALDADAEYKELYPENEGVRPSEKSWSHFLIQQSFPSDLRIYPSRVDTSEYSIYFSLDITINEVDFKLPRDPVGSECSQLMFYVTFQNIVDNSIYPAEEYGKNGIKMWFGMPILDSRYGSVAEYIAFDSGFEGATNWLIYTMPSRFYMGTQWEVGKTYHIDFDILEYLQGAFIEAHNRNALPNCQWQNMAINYMNFGWEVLGNYSVSSTISNLDIYWG